MYVALGDSYAAGVGAGYPSGTCWRSDQGYPPLVATALESRLSYQACLGAAIADVEGSQLAALSDDTEDDTEYVSITVGGNDIDFVGVLTACAKPAWMGSSQPAIDAALRVLRTQLRGRLTSLYAEVLARAPEARIVVAGYPRLFRPDGFDCNLATFFSPQEIAQLNAAADELSAVIEAAAVAVGFEYLDVRTDFADHAVCDDVEWLRGLSLVVPESYHPNELGHLDYARTVAAAFGAPVPVTMAPSQPSRTAPVPVPQVPREVPVFTPPDLTSEESLAGAAAAGLDPAEVEALARRAHAGEAVAIPDVAAWDRLHALDRQVRGG